MKKFKFKIATREFFILPTFGITYNEKNCKFALAFAWFNILFCIRFGIKEDSK